MRSCSQFAGHQAARGGKMRAAATIDWDGFEIGSAAPDAGARGRGGTHDEARTSGGWAGHSARSAVRDRRL